MTAPTFAAAAPPLLSTRYLRAHKPTAAAVDRWDRQTLTVSYYITAVPTTTGYTTAATARYQITNAEIIECTPDITYTLQWARRYSLKLLDPLGDPGP